MIKREFFVITIFLSNIAFATVLPVDHTETLRDTVATQEQNEETKSTLHNAAVTHLVNKGLDTDVAQNRVAASLSHSETEAQLLSQQIVQNEKISYNNIIEYVAKAALHRRKVDLGKSQEITALKQRSHTLGRYS